MTDEEFHQIVPNNRDPQYGPGFFKFTELDHGWSNILFGNVLHLLFRPKSVVEFGCGTGGVIAAPKRCGARVQGIDGSPHCIPFIERVDAELVKDITIHDLAKPMPAPLGVHDLAVSIETLEHISPEGADTAVKTICDSANMVVVTACPPTGRNHLLHLNEQPFPYWVERFTRNGLALDPQATAAVHGVMRSFYDFHTAGRYPVVPTWFFSSSLGVFKRS